MFFCSFAELTKGQNDIKIGPILYARAVTAVACGWELFFEGDGGVGAI